jgi:hypothetical protein
VLAARGAAHCLCRNPIPNNKETAMGSSPSPPPAPDPVATANAQARMNRDTAVTQYGLNATDQRTPYGNLAYTQQGTWSDGTPHFLATTTLSPEQQELYRLNTETQKGIGRIGLDQTRRIGDLLATPVDLSNEATEARLMELGRRRLDPMLDQRWQAIETDLANKGIHENTEAYRRALERFGQERNDAFGNLALTGRGQAVQEALTARNQPINEITALLSGSQVHQPSFAGTPPSQVAPVDYAGLVKNNYDAQLAAYNAQLQRQNAMYGALGSIGGSALGFAMGGPFGSALGGALGGWGSGARRTA